MSPPNLPRYTPRLNIIHPLEKIFGPVFWIKRSFIFFYNLVKSIRLGKPAGKNPWKANSLEWHTPEMPPVHGNFGKELPVVYRWPYDFSVPGIDREYIPQHVAPSEVPTAKVEKT